MRYIFAVCAAFAMLCGALPAAVITLDPISGSVDAQPGQLAGWGFTILNDNPAEWISFTGSLLIDETNPSVGSYVDLIGAQGGPVDFSLQPQTTWTETFSDPDQTGLGEYLIDPNAPAGAQDSGAILVMWEQFAGDPLSCNCMPAAFSEEVAFQVTVDSVAPEPDTIWMATMAAVFLIGRARIGAGRKRQRSSGNFLDGRGWPIANRPQVGNPYLWGMGMLLLVCSALSAQTAGVITEFSAGLSANTQPFGIVVAPDGNLWFTEYMGSRIGRITPAGVITEFSAGLTGRYLRVKEPATRSPELQGT